ncbi:MAG: hypothetical protein KDA24_08605 [Deltaproteobacteria bacterium]|nr:hypothetical protein [Deltaproteobacteria bacterium]
MRSFIGLALALSVATVGCGPQTTVEAGEPRDVDADANYVFDPTQVYLKFRLQLAAGQPTNFEMGLSLIGADRFPPATYDYYRDHVSVWYSSEVIEIDLDPADPYAITMHAPSSDLHNSGGVFDALPDHWGDDPQAWLRSFEPTFGLRADPSVDWDLMEPGQDHGQLDLIIDGEVTPGGPVAVFDLDNQVVVGVTDPPGNGAYGLDYRYEAFLSVDVLR